jgi:hypothetical protein
MAEADKSERGDSRVYWRTIFSALLWTGIAVLVIAAGIYGVFWLPYRDPGKVKPRVVELVELPEAPRTEPIAEEVYEWVDRKAGIVRIPIDEAMKIQVERLGVREKALEIQGARVASKVPTDAGSGRSVKKKDRPAAAKR